MEKLVRYYIGVLATLIILQSCTGFLDEEVFSQLAPNNYLNRQEGIESVLTDAYARAANMNMNNSVYVITPQEWPTDILFQSGDNVERTARDYIDFNWDPAIDFIGNNWDAPYQCIRNVNILLERIQDADIPETAKQLYTAESRFLRAVSYYKLYFMFGPVPLRTSTEGDLQLARSTDEEIIAFIESELVDAISNLPMPEAEAAYGRAHKGAALGYLCKLYLNTKQWQKCADVALRIVNEFDYELFPDYEQLFSVANERNKEYLWIRPAYASADRATANSWMNASFPDNFAEAPSLGIKFLSNFRNWPNEFRIYDSFYRTFDPADARRKLLVTSYIDNGGQTVSLLGTNNIRSFKYLPDPNAEGPSHGNDIPEIRYADILLCRAEALNELNGPTQEAIDLINEVRNRVDLMNIQLDDFANTDALRDHILLERGWEFYSEGHRRLDLIRMGKFISNAQKRGKTNAKPYHVRYPIPQAVMDSDPLLVQNEGY